MPSKPLAIGLVLASALLTVTACSSGDDSPSAGDTSPDKTDKTDTTDAGGDTQKLVKVKGKDDIKNVIVKTSTGTKISLSAKAPGHELMQQTYNPDTSVWSAPTAVFKDDTRFCHGISVRKAEDTIAATVRCSISAKDVDGTQVSYALVTSDGKTWKRMDLAGATGKPIMSPVGNVVAWSSPTSYLLWNAGAGTFKTVKYAQSEDEPTVAVLQGNGVLLMLKASEGDKKTCVFSFRSSTFASPTAKLINSTLPQDGHPKCQAIGVRLQGDELIGDFNSTSSTENAQGKKETKTSVFSVAFAKLPTGKWAIKVQ